MGWFNWGNNSDPKKIAYQNFNRSVEKPHPRYLPETAIFQIARHD
jgi:hypothetical protein